jgi:hypothetical protein
MSSLDQTESDPLRPGRSPAVERGAVCSVTAGAPDQAFGPGTGASVPPPRSADGRVPDRRAPDAGDAGASAVTAANLLTGLGARLRAAYERGTTIDELSAACRRSPADVRELLARAGTDLSPAAAEAAVEIAAGRRNRPVSRWALPAAPVPSAAPPDQGPPLVKRPSPARRLSRLHHRGEDRPDAGPTPPPAGGTDGSGPVVAGSPPAAAPLGVLIGGTPNLPDPAGHPDGQRFVLVDARVIRPGRGTSLVVLPAWREAIAVSVPTERLLTATGLGFDDLPGAELSVLINPDALHDRELALHGWRAGPAAGTTDGTTDGTADSAAARDRGRGRGRIG